MAQVKTEVLPPAGEALPAAAKLGDDLLRGAGEIAEFLFGDRRERRKVYHLAESGHFPVFRFNSTINARRSTILRWIEEQESKATPPS